MAEDVSGLTSVDTAMLEPMVRDLLGEPKAVVAAEWSCCPLGGGIGDGLGLYRVTGSARVGGASQSWALVVKVCAAADGADPEAWDYPAREALVYRSGLLAALPGGLAAPRCLAVETQPDGTTRLWLEAITDAHPGPWPLERYALVACHLGRFNGAYLTGAAMPADAWLSRRWLRGWVEAAGLAVAELQQFVGPDAPPLTRQLYPPPVVAELTRLWTERERFLAALDRLPQTFCHHDAFRRNLLGRKGPQGHKLVALDWADAGYAAVGQELVPLVLGSLSFFEAVGIAPHDLDAACFTSCMVGLREAGWNGDERLVRLGFTADAALHVTVGALRQALPLMTDPTLHPFVEDLLGLPLADAVEAWTELWPFQFELADEARALLPAVG